MLCFCSADSVFVPCDLITHLYRKRRRRLISIEARQRQPSQCLGPTGGAFSNVIATDGGGTLVLRSFISDSVCRRRRRRRLAVVGRLVGRTALGWLGGVVEASCYRTHPEELGEYMARLTHYERFIDRKKT